MYLAKVSLVRICSVSLEEQVEKADDREQEVQRKIVWALDQPAREPHDFIVWMRRRMCGQERCGLCEGLYHALKL